MPITPIQDYDHFNTQIAAIKQSCYLEFFAKHPDRFQIKKEKTIAKNLERIFTAALKVSNKKGFHAMSMRDLGKEVDMSLGALYNYFSSKEELLEMMQRHRRSITSRILTSAIGAETDAQVKLRTAIRTHLYLSEAMQPWFFFSYMEAKNLSSQERKAAVQGELNTEQIFTDILVMGQAQGVFLTEDCQMAAALIKAMVQDWYLKRAKHARRNTDVETYAGFVIAFIEKSLINPHLPTPGER